jgi:hypothetical protein
MRPLSQGERALARSVFGAAIDLDRVRLAPVLPGGGAITLGRVILFPHDAQWDFAEQPARLQAWLLHELTHVWQFQTRPWRTLASWARVLLSGGYGPAQRGYLYAHPFDWARLNLEQQASVVEHAFLLRAGAATTQPPLTLADYAGRTPFERLTQV